MAPPSAPPGAVQDEALAPSSHSLPQPATTPPPVNEFGCDVFEADPTSCCCRPCGSACSCLHAIFCEPWYRFNPVSPGRYEACVVTIASMVVSAFFWVLALLTAFDDGASTIIAAVLESGVDCIGTVAVMWRFWRVNALEGTLANAVTEARTSVVLSFSMILLAGILAFFSTYHLVTTIMAGKSHISRSGLTAEVRVARATQCTCITHVCHGGDCPMASCMPPCRRLSPLCSILSAHHTAVGH